MTSALRRLAALTAILALSGCDTGPKYTPATWVQTPSERAIRDAWPAFARIAGIEGRVRVRCNYTLAGALERCRMLGVAPEGLNFDKALPQLLALYVVDPQTLNGDALPGEIEFVVHFRPPEAPPAYSGEPLTEAELTQARRIVRQQLAVFDRYGPRSNAHRTVGIDRFQQVAVILDRVFTAEEEDRREALAHAFVQAMVPSSRREFLSGRPSYFSVSYSEMEAVSPELYAVNARIAQSLRDEYCAQWSCDATLPERKPRR